MKKSDKKIADISDFIGLSREHLYRQIKDKKLSTERINMILDFIKIQQSDFYDTSIEIIQPQGNITQVRKNNTSKDILVPFYDVDFYAGNSIDFLNGTTTPNYYMDIPEFRGCTAFRAYSDSMEKIIYSGNILFGKKIEDWQSHLEYGAIYGIISTDFRRYLKYIRKAKNDSEYFLLKSENEKYDDFEIPKNKIYSIWLIDGWITKKCE